MIVLYEEVVYSSIEAVLVVIEACERGCKSERELIPFLSLFPFTSVSRSHSNDTQYSHNVQDCRHSSRLLSMRQQDYSRVFELSNYFLLLK